MNLPKSERGREDLGPGAEDERDGSGVGVRTFSLR